MRNFILTLCMGALMTLTGCSSKSLQNYDGTTPPVDIKTYFSGPIRAWGIVQDRSGKVVQRFDVQMMGRWEGDVGTLEEEFKYYDGRTQQRIWTIKKIGENKFEGTAGDIIGVAKGAQNGSAVQWAYQMDLEVKGTTYRVTFDDWMFMMNDGILINRSYIKKFGITMAELTLFMQKEYVR
jgi:Protein of unknown function (DUF3833)